MERAVVLAAVLSAAVGSVNYCGAKMCARSNAHTYCQYPSGPGPRCAGYTEDRLTGQEKARVLARLNRRRSEAAVGLRQLPPAANMLKLRWVEELSREAQLWADQCAPPGTPEEHDACRDLYSITVGQCVASVVGEAPGLRAESMVDTWYLQALQYRGNISYTTNTKRYDMDFAQMLWAHTYLVGCARSRFMSEVNGRMRTVIRLVCNLAPRGPAGPLWLPGAPTAACPPRARPDTDLAGLCTYLNDMSDVYDVSNEMTQKEQTVLNAVLEIEGNQSLDHHGSLDEIYLTNMAIATLSQPAVTESFPNSMQKRDIVEPIFLEDEVETEIAGTKVRVIDDVIAKMVREKSTTKELEVVTKPHIVGRPKSYRIDELDELADKDLNYANTRPVETTPMSELDVYIEYEFQDISAKYEGEENVTESDVNVTSMSMITLNSTEIESTTTQLTLDPAVENLTRQVNVTNEALKKLLELSKKTEEFPSDPETARELQEALERMEMSLADEAPVKVRRELRRPPPELQHLEEVPLDREPPPQQFQAPVGPLPEDIMRNSSMAKPPMLDMMFKYLPFMKKYQKAVTDSAAADQHDLWFFAVCVKLSLFFTFNL